MGDEEKGKGKKKWYRHAWPSWAPSAPDAKVLEAVAVGHVKTGGHGAEAPGLKEQTKRQKEGMKRTGKKKKERTSKKGRDDEMRKKKTKEKQQQEKQQRKWSK